MDIMLKDVRLSFPVLGAPQEYKEGDGKPRWSATVHIEPGSANDKAIRAAIKAEAANVWKDKAEIMLKQIEHNSNRYCYRDGDTVGRDECAGLMVLAAHRAYKTKTGTNPPPLLLDNTKTPLKPGDGRLYSGCYVNIKVSIWAQAGENSGMRCSFSAVQFWRDGDAFSSNNPSADGFDTAVEGIDADDIA